MTQLIQSIRHFQRMAQRFTVIACVCLLACSFGERAVAGRMLHHIEFTLPRCGQAGTTVEVILQGSHIDDPRDVVFFRPGIRAVEVERIDDLERPIGRAHGGVAQQQVRCKFEIAPDCPLGEHPFRLLTGDELSTASTFWVTPFPVVDEVNGGVGKNDTRETAQKVPTVCTVRGHIQSTREGDVDVYCVQGRAGDHLSVEVDSVRLTELFYADSEFDLMVRILDQYGVQLASNDDSALHVQDPIASVILPHDGEYYVEVKQRIFKGGAHVYYNATIGTNPRPLAVYPAGGQPGESLRLTMLGDPQGAYQQTVTLPEQTGWFDYFGEMPSSLPMRVSAFPNRLEDAEAEFTQVDELPAALNGVIEAPGDIDRFRVNVKKGETYRVRVFARSLGTPLDPQISLRHVDSETPEVTGDDATHEERDLFSVSRAVRLKDGLDPSLIWSPEKDGEYELTVQDMRSLGDPTSVYRIEVEPARDGIHTYLAAPVIDRAECPRLTNIVIPQGNQWTVNVSLEGIQGNKYRGPLELVATGLPEGVRMIAPRVNPGQKSVPVQFVADATAPFGGKTFQLTAQPLEDSNGWESGSHQSFPFLSHSGGRAWHCVQVDTYTIAVTEPAPYHIEVEEPQIPLAQNGELAIQVNIVRNPGFHEPVDVQFDWVPPGVKAQPTITIPGDESSIILRLAASSSARPGIWPMAVTSSTTSEGDYYLGVGRVRTSSPLFQVEIAEPYLALKNQPSAVRRGETAEVVWEVEHKKEFPGEAEAVLLGLPKGVSVVGGNPHIRSGDKQLVFQVAATNEALMGQYRDLTCEIIVRQEGQVIRQRTGKGVLRVDPALTTSTVGTSK